MSEPGVGVSTSGSVNSPIGNGSQLTGGGFDFDSEFEIYAEELRVLFKTLSTLFKYPSMLILNPNPFADNPGDSTDAWREWKEAFDSVFSLTPTGIETFAKGFPVQVKHLKRPYHVGPNSKWSIRLESSHSFFESSFQQAHECLVYTIQDLAKIHTKIRKFSHHASYLAPLPKPLTTQEKTLRLTLENFERKVEEHLSKLASNDTAHVSIANPDGRERTVKNMCRTNPTLVLEYLLPYLVANPTLVRECLFPYLIANLGALDLGQFGVFSDSDSATPVQSPESTPSKIQPKSHRPDTDSEPKSTSSCTSAKHAENSMSDADSEPTLAQNPAPPSLRISKRHSKKHTTYTESGQPPTTGAKPTHLHSSSKHAKMYKPPNADSNPTPDESLVSPSSFKSRKNRERLAPDTNSGTVPAQGLKSDTSCALAKATKKHTSDIDSECTQARSQEPPCLRKSKRSREKRTTNAVFETASTQQPDSIHTCTSSVDSYPTRSQNVGLAHLWAPDANTCSYGRLTIYSTAKGKTCIGCTYPDRRTSRVNVREKGREMIFITEGKPRNIRCAGSPQPICLPADDGEFPRLWPTEQFFVERGSDKIYVQQSIEGKIGYKEVPYFTRDFVLRMCSFIERVNLSPSVQQELQETDLKDLTRRFQLKTTEKYFLIMFGEQELSRVSKRHLAEAIRQNERILQMVVVILNCNLRKSF